MKIENFFLTFTKIISIFYIVCGEMAERSMAADCKSALFMSSKVRILLSPPVQRTISKYQKIKKKL